MSKKLLRVDRPITVRLATDGGFSWVCPSFPACPGAGHDRTRLAAMSAGVDHLRTAHLPVTAPGGGGVIEDYYALWIGLLDGLRPFWTVLLAAVVGTVVIAIGTTGGR